MTDNVVHLFIDDETDKKSAAEFLRELADAMDRGEEVADGCMVILYEKQGDMFRTATRKWRLDFLQQVGLLQTAIFDVQNLSSDD